MVGFVFKNTIFYQIFTATIRNDVIYKYTCTLIKIINHKLVVKDLNSLSSNINSMELYVNIWVHEKYYARKLLMKRVRSFEFYLNLY